MVLGNVVCALNLASSLMMNGVCCYYQMKEEDERRKKHEASIQRAIRNELDIHRHEEMSRRHNEAVVVHFQAQRRRKLMTQKKQVGMEVACDEVFPTNNRASPDIRDGSDCLPIQNSTGYSSAPNSFVKPEAGEYISPQTIRSNDALRQNLCVYTKERGGLSSLLDDSLEDDEDFEEIMIE